MFFKPWQPLCLPALCAVGGIVAADVIAPEAAARLWPVAGTLAALLFAAGVALRVCGKRLPLVAGISALATAMLFFALHAHRLSAGPGPLLAARIPAPGCAVQAVGVVDEEPGPPPGTRFLLRLESLEMQGEKLAVSAPVLVRWSGDLPRYGDRVQVDGDLHRLAPPRNPGTFDAPQIWHRKGVYAELRVRYPNDARILASGCGSPLMTRAFALRHWMERMLALDLDDSPGIAALIQSMVLGARGESLENTKALFQATGTMHLFAVSGMNVAMLACVCAFLLQAVGIRRRAMACLIIPLLWIYCYATGLTASSLRATIMATVAFAGLCIDRPALPWNTLAASALLLLAWDPGQLFTPGFQLSFGMVVFLLAVARPVEERIRRWVRPDPFLPRALWPRSLVWRLQAQRVVLNALAVSVVAWVGSMPLTAYYFHLWSPSTVPANLVAVLLAWIMLVLGLASVLAGAFFHGLAILFNNANWAVAHALLFWITKLAAIPGGHVYVEMPSLRPAPLCELEVLDIPGGGAVHLRTHVGSRRDWLVDCGSASAFTYSVAPYLRSRGVNILDGFFLTHGDSHHIGGAVPLLQELAPAEVIDSPLRDRSSYRRAVHAALESAGRGKTIVARGDVLTLAPGVALHVLYPPAGIHVSRADDKALVLRLDVAGRRILLSSDAGFPTETWLLENAAPGELRSDMWIKQAHPREISGTPDFLDAVQPALVVASGAAFPPEEQIGEDWAAQLQARGIRLLRQDRAGAVKITIDSRGTWRAEPFLAQ